MAANEFFDRLNASARWDIGVSINRTNSLPLDANSVFSSLEAAQDYAAGRPAEGILNNAYPGQILAVVTDDKTAIYYIDADKQLKQVSDIDEVAALIGVIPEGSDAQTIVEYINTKTANVATSSALAELQGAIEAVNVAINGKEATDGAEATEGLTAKSEANRLAIIAEAARAEAAEKELADTIKAIDFVDADELDAAIQNFATKTYVDDEIAAVERAISNLNHFKAEVVDSVSKVTESGVLYLIKDENIDGADTYNEYIVIDGQATLIGDTTTDLSNYYDKTVIDSKFDAIDKVTQAELNTYKEEVTAAINNAKAAAIADADGKLASKANISDVVANTVFNSFKDTNTAAIQAAREGAVSDIEAKGYAVAATVKADLDKKVDTATIAHTSDGVDEGATVSGTTLNIVVDAYRKSETYTKDEVNTAITNKIADMTGGESAADVLVALNDYKKAIDAEIYGAEKVASWTNVEGKYSPVYSQDSRLDVLAATINELGAAVDDVITPKDSEEISVAEDGTLGIKKLNVNKLYQDDGETLVLNGGSSAFS